MIAGKFVLLALLVVALVISLRYASSHPRWGAALAIVGAAISGYAVGNGSYSWALECVVIVCAILFGGSLKAEESPQGSSADSIDDPAEH